MARFLRGKQEKEFAAESQHLLTISFTHSSDILEEEEDEEEDLSSSFCLNL